jgi:AcrR family transcriptional regulator
MNRKEIQRKRTMTYFINAAHEILEEEGIKKVTIRKVAKKAGYNSATLYNYFENLDHLIFFAAMRYIKDYTLALPEYLKDADNALDRFLKVWECFCHFSYKKPEIYYAIFFADLDKDLEDYVIEYYKLFPEELGSQTEDISNMLLKHNIYKTLLHEGILLKVMKGKMEYDEALEKTMKYINIIINAFLIK